jgi:hypothetical protein
MNHDPWRIIKLVDHVLAYKTSLSEAVYKLRSTELSVQDSLDLTVYRLSDIVFSDLFSCFPSVNAPRMLIRDLTGFL